MTGLRRSRLGRVTLILIMAAVFFAIPHEEPALGLAMETMGSDQPVAEQVDWAKGVIDVVDLASRVYSYWVNGNENFYYRGDTEDLNATLRDFAAIKADVREVILRPGPGEARTFDGLRIPCDWQVHVPSGIYLAVAKEEKGTHVFTKHATMTVFVSGGGIKLEKLQIPAGVTVLELKDLVERYLAGLKSKDHTVRGHAAYLLGEMDPYVEEVILPLVEMLKDENRYVRHCAANALGRMGARALAALPTLRQGLQDENENLRKAFQEAIAKIEGAESEEAKEHRAVREQIRKFRLPAEAAAEAEEATLWISIMPSAGTVKALGELRVIALAWNLNQDAAKTGEWEIRTADNTKRVARLPYNWPIREEEFILGTNKIKGGLMGGGGFTLSKQQVRHIGPVEEGEYLLAWSVAGKRCSNVLRFRIGGEHDVRKEPLLKLVEIEPRRDRGLPLLGIRACRRTEDDPAFMASNVAYPTLNVNGRDRKPAVMKWCGPDGPLKPGGHYTYIILDLGWYRPLIVPDKKHVIIAKVSESVLSENYEMIEVGEHESNALTLTYGRTLSNAWDAATGRLAPAPVPRPMLHGVVLGPDGEYEVHLMLRNENGGLVSSFDERTDEEGRYAFHNVPRGRYELAASPVGKGQPELCLGKVTVADRPGRLDLDLHKKFGFSGKVTHPDGKPAADVTVMATWKSPDGLAKYNDFATTDARGRYELAAPYSEASYVGISGPGPHAKTKRRVKDGRNDVDFVLLNPAE